MCIIYDNNEQADKVRVLLLVLPTVKQKIILFNCGECLKTVNKKTNKWQMREDRKDPEGNVKVSKNFASFDRRIRVAHISKFEILDWSPGLQQTLFYDVQCLSIVFLIEKSRSYHFISPFSR